MKKLIMICALSALILTAGSAQADIGVHTFDEIGGNGGPMPNGYGGFNWKIGSWTEWYYLNAPAFGIKPSGYLNGMVSSPNVAYSQGLKASTISGGLFDFGGAYLTAAWRDGLNIKVDGYLGATQLYTQTVIVNTTGPTWFDFNYYGIDKLEFLSSGGTQNPDLNGQGFHFAMDNFTVVPAPAAALLGMLGLSVAAIKLRRIA